MSQVCPECGIQGTCMDSGSIVVTDGPRKGVHFFGEYDCLVRQVANLKAKRDKAMGLLERSFSVCRDGIASYSLIPNGRLDQLATEIESFHKESS